jgi:2-dehydro-3-deoxyphosphogluconate aldolase/(4S)-4-hydroxy-2-oxoglutarate aldolase
LPFLKLIPSGGVTLDNAAEFIRAGAVAVALGSNLVNGASVAKREWGAITERARILSQSVLDARSRS